MAVNIDVPYEKRALKDQILQGRAAAIQAQATWNRGMREQNIAIRARPTRGPPADKKFAAVYFVDSDTFCVLLSSTLSTTTKGRNVTLIYDGEPFEGEVIAFGKTEDEAENAFREVETNKGRAKKIESQSAKKNISSDKLYCVIFLTLEKTWDAVETCLLRYDPVLKVGTEVEMWYGDKHNAFFKAHIIGFGPTMEFCEENAQQFVDDFVGEGGDQGGDDGENGPDDGGDEGNAGRDESAGDVVPHVPQPLAPVAALIADSNESRDEEMREEEAQEERQEEVAMEVAEGAEAREMEEITGDDFDFEIDLPSLLEEDNQSGDESLPVDMDDEDLPEDLEDKFALPVEKEKEDADMF